ncbi:MAG: hypothetical protein ACI9TO_000238 [Rickettsiales bacterium]|jgi:hypothetical protein
MNKLILKRKYRSGEATLGVLLDQENKEICKTLENPWINNEVGISCIPEGTYEVVSDNLGRFQYWKILNVPNRTGVEIHNGNKEQHTKGCILFGSKWGFIDDQLAVLGSKSTLRHLKNNEILADKFQIKIISQ